MRLKNSGKLKNNQDSDNDDGEEAKEGGSKSQIPNEKKVAALNRKKIKKEKKK